MFEPTIRQIASKARVSTATVSRVINNDPRVNRETREKVLKIIQKFNYHPNPMAQGLSRHRTRVFGVFTHAEPDMKAHYFVETLRGIQHALNSNSYNLLVNPSHLDVNGLLFLAPSENDPRLVQASQRQVPIVLLHNASREFSSVDLDNASAAHEVVTHLVKLGHKRVGMINGKQEVANGKDRFKGYQKAIEDQSLLLDEEIIVDGFFSQERGYKAMQKLLALKDPPTAVFAANDHMAIGALKAVREAGLNVPQDIAVAGFDDIEASAIIDPPLTTIRQPLFQMGYEAARFLIDSTSGQRMDFHPRQILVQGKLVIRESCGAYGRSLEQLPGGASGRRGRKTLLRK